MNCRLCARPLPPSRTDLCEQCTPRHHPKFYLMEADMPGNFLLEWNPAGRIMDTTGDKHYATAWDSEESAQKAAEFYGHVWHATNRGRLKVIRFD